MVEEGELLPHERAVDAVLARDLVEEAPELGAALARALGDGVGHQPGHGLERDRRGGRAKLGPGANQQVRALALEARTQVHLSLDVGEAGEDALHVALADRGALAEDRPEQPPGGLDLRVEVREYIALEGNDGCVHDCPSRSAR